MDQSHGEHSGWSPQAGAAAAGGRPVNAIEDARWMLAELEDSLRARALRHAPVNGAGAEHAEALQAAADEVSRCRSELSRVASAPTEASFAVLRQDLVDAGRRTERIVEEVSEALERIDAERCLLSEHFAEQMETTKALIERWRKEQAGQEAARTAELERFVDESARAAEAMRASYSGLGGQMEALQQAAAGFEPLFRQAEHRLIERFDEQQAELARQRGWIDQKLQELRSELESSNREEQAHTRTFVMVLQFAAALLPVAAVALALFLPALLRWLNLGS